MKRLCTILFFLCIWHGVCCSDCQKDVGADSKKQWSLSDEEKKEIEGLIGKMKRDGITDDDSKQESVDAHSKKQWNLSEEEKRDIEELVSQMERDGITNDDSKLTEEIQNNKEAQKKIKELMNTFAKRNSYIDGGT